MDRSVKFLNDRKREAEMGHSLSLNGDVDVESMTSGLTAAQRELNRGYGSTNSSSDVNGVGGSMPNCEHGSDLKMRRMRWERRKNKVKWEFRWVGAGICRKHPPDWE